MSDPVIAIMAPGHMGHAIGGHLVSRGLRVITNLTGRSADTLARAERAGLEDVGSDAALIDQADMLLSVLPPGSALDFARRIAATVKDHGGDFLYVDCNAVSPATAAEIAKVLDAVGIRCVDAAIRGGAAVDGKPQPRIYVSGPGAEEFAALNAYGLDIHTIGTQAGQASGLKIAGAAVSKGVVLLVMQAFATAKALGVEKELAKDLGADDAQVKAARRRAPNFGPDAYRWATEMDEIAATVGATGLSPATFEGFADLCRLAEGTALGSQTKEDEANRSDLDEIVDILAEAAGKRGPR
jgi:3-hydroxyisobutyrate dehydrogenase-like beta-hydroxyacid dehydrogenase